MVEWRTRVCDRTKGVVHVLQLERPEQEALGLRFDPLGAHCSSSQRAVSKEASDTVSPRSRRVRPSRSESLSMKRFW